MNARCTDDHLVGSRICAPHERAPAFQEAALLRNLLPRRALILALAIAACVSSAHAVSVPAGFTVENAVPGTTFTVPVGHAFLPDGRFIVIEKGGTAWMVRNGVKLPTPVLSIPSEVLDDLDRGFLGVAVDPKYFVNHFVYFLYTVDPDSNNIDTNANAFGRLTRYQMRTTGDTNTVLPSSRTILLGVDWTHGPLIASGSHSIGSVRFGSDGSLLVGAGDGANFINADAGGLYAAAFGAGKTDPSEDVGAFRAQDLNSLCGKILRINPLTGNGYMSNPYHDSNLKSVRSRVWAYGLRNPYRFNLRAGTGSADTSAANPGVIYVGDVGWDTWEEMDIVTQGGQNFGWPCYEGFGIHPIFPLVHPAHSGCETYGTPENPASARAPAAAWHHSTPSLSQPPGFSGNASVGGIFYSDTLYPAGYRGRYFFADYGQQWMKTATVDANNNLLSIQPFGSGMDLPVDVVRDPLTGNIQYISISTGEVRRIRYTGAVGGNTPPVASATASPTAGIVPLNVSFSSNGSFDADLDPLSYSWTFGDGGTSTQPNPIHTYLVSGPFVAVLTVSDGHGGVSQSTVGITVGTTSSFPTSGILDNFDRPNGAIGGAWVGNTSGLTIVSNTMHQISYEATTVLNMGPFGPEQEAYVTMQAVTSSAVETDLMLKVQGLLWSDGHIEVRYEPVANRVVVSTYHPQTGWHTWGIVSGVSYSAGDQFGARALSNGLVEIYKSGQQVGQVSVLGWPYADQGGRLGMTLTGSTSTVFDNFGGGNWTPQNAPPGVTVTSPNGGESWTGGSSHAITWVATDEVGVTGVDVHYQDGPAAPWVPLALDAPNTGSFTWFVHNTPSASARVRVRARDAAGNLGADSSNAVFAIVRTPGGIAPTTLRDFLQPGTQPLGAANFQPSGNCTSCHGGYNSAVEPGHNFKGTMMGNAARDPLFHACLAVAEQDAPSAGDLCIRCHAPMAWLQGKSQPTSGANIDDLGRDGVSCDFCHRLVDPKYQAGVNPPEDAGVLGAMLPAHIPTSYANGQYVVDPQLRRRGPFTDPVTPHSFLASSFHTRSEMCGTCHDVSNPVFTRTGPSKYAPGPFDSQADSISSLTLMPLERTFSEWKNSAFPAGIYAPEFAGTKPGGIVSSCQDCHLRAISGKGCSDAGAPTRPNLPLHDMTGGNTWAGGVIGQLYPSETDPVALGDAAARATAMLQKAATLLVTMASEADSFRASIRVTNHTGHKLPTGYPEGRRMWIHVVARNGSGQIVYESAPYDSTTGVLGGDSNARVYEAALGISTGLGSALGLPPGPSFHFALNDTMYKDNRIPPLGFSNAAYAAFGGAPVDPAIPGERYADGQNFDLASYPLPPSARTVTATLYYQTTSKEYVEFLRDQNVTNAAGQTLHSAWSTSRRSPPVAMARDSASFNQLDAPPRPEPVRLALRAYSNPFRGRLELELAMPSEGEVVLDVMDVTGRSVRHMARGRLASGTHRLTWDGRDNAGRDTGAGVYWAVVRIGPRRLTQRVVRLH